MAISRSQMKRQLYQIGGLTSLYSFNNNGENQQAIYPRLGQLNSGLSSAEQELQQINQSIDQVQSTLGESSGGPQGQLLFGNMSINPVSGQPDAFKIDHFAQKNIINNSIPSGGARKVPALTDIYAGGFQAGPLGSSPISTAIRSTFADGGISSLQQARDILESQSLPGEFLAYINPQEAAMLKYMGGAGIPINSSGIPSYFVKSIGKAISGAVKGVTGAVKGAVGAVKDIASSDIGKLALLAAGGYYLGGGSLFGLQRAGMSGFSFANLPGAGLFQQAKTGIGNLLLGTPGDIGGRVAGTGLLSKLGGAAKAIGGSNLLSAGLGFLGGAATTMLTPQQIETGMQRNPTAVRAYLAQYYKNINPEATESEAEQYANEQTREYAAEGGLIGRQEYGIGGLISQMINNNPEIFKKLQMSSPVKQLQARYMMNLNPEMDEEEVIDYIRENAAYGGPMGEPRENQQGIKELDYRQEGGFVPVGIKEKADDVPAMLSKNEFVFTADAVRGAGNGDVEKGAQRLYNTMKTLENGGTV